jgi:MFS family permease
MPEKYVFTIPLLIILHIFAGIASAGVNLTVGTIGMKLAPPDQATPYLACASLATNLGSGLGPLAGGVLAHYFSLRQLTLDFAWSSPGHEIRLGFIDLSGLDFLFAITSL